MIAVICSSDKLYPDVVPQVARWQVEVCRRAVAVVLAGHPGEQRNRPGAAAGVDRFIFMQM